MIYRTILQKLFNYTTLIYGKKLYLNTTFLLCLTFNICNTVASTDTDVNYAL